VVAEMVAEGFVNVKMITIDKIRNEMGSSTGKAKIVKWNEERVMIIKFRAS
jgi:citrate lyase alpha subunit